MCAVRAEFAGLYGCAGTFTFSYLLGDDICYGGGSRGKGLMGNGWIKRMRANVVFWGV